MLATTQTIILRACEAMLADPPMIDYDARVRRSILAEQIANVLDSHDFGDEAGWAYTLSSRVQAELTALGFVW